MLAILLSACGGSESGNDGGARDAGGVDASSGDAGPGDAGPGDAGTTDAGAMDAGSGDAGPGDAGPEDAGAGDAGPSCMDLGGAEVGGHCWFQGDWGESCDDACGRVSLSYDPATGTYFTIGTAASAAQCRDVMAALPDPSDSTACGFDRSASWGGGPEYSNGAGCVADRQACLRTTFIPITRSFADAQGPVTSTAADARSARACACR